MFGPHLTLDLYGCDKDKLMNHDFIFGMLNEMPEMLGMHKFAAPQLSDIPSQKNSFDKGGLTGFVILVESHLSIHTFPADQYASFDIFSCKYFSEDNAIKYLMEKLGAERVEINRIERGRDFVKHYPRNVQRAATIAKNERILVHN
jgi:S-adenosylmethionine decarboxylase